MEHYTPKHPLPAEIESMATDETVCQFCGVSYLIHREIKALEDKLAEAEKQLAKLRGLFELISGLRFAPKTTLPTPIDDIYHVN